MTLKILYPDSIYLSLSYPLLYNATHSFGSPGKSKLFFYKKKLKSNILFGNPAFPPSYHFEEGIAGLFSCNTDYTFKYTPPPSSVHPFTISLAVENQMGGGANW